MRRVAIMVLAAVLAGGCGATSTQPPEPSPEPSVAASPSSSTAAPRKADLPAGTSVHDTESDGLDRSYRVYRPRDVKRPAPVVVVMHGWRGDAAGVERHYGWNSVADQHGFVVVYPDGMQNSWHAGGCCGAAEDGKVDDVGFIEQTLDEVSRDVDVDRNRLFAAGMSNGGMMAYRLACETDTFAAIGPVTGTMFRGCPDADPVSVRHVHGSEDNIVRYDGRRGDLSVDGLSIPSVNAHWRRVDDCRPPSETTAGQVTTSRASCSGGRAVELVSVAGAGHEWPTAATSGLDTTATLWGFFARHPRR